MQDDPSTVPSYSRSRVAHPETPGDNTMVKQGVEEEKDGSLLFHSSPSSQVARQSGGRWTAGAL